jgi:hypothetical protein
MKLDLEMTDPVALAESLGAAIATFKHEAKEFGAGVFADRILEHAEVLTQHLKLLCNQYNDLHKGG